MAAKVTSDSRVTIPKWVRDHLGVAPGDSVDFRRAADGALVIAKASEDVRPKSRFAKLHGSAGPRLTTDEIMKLLRDE